MSKKESDVDEVEFDYNIQNQGKTHILVVEYPEGCDEECFLITLKAYLRAQSENLRRRQARVNAN